MTLPTIVLPLLLLALGGCVTVQSTPIDFYALSAKMWDGKVIEFSRLKGKVVVIVNVASECGYTDMGYSGMVHMFNKYKRNGLVVLAFPCNQFGEQEPGTDEEVHAFAKERGAKFPIMSKVNVNGRKTHSVFRLAKKDAQVRQIDWNFEYFIYGMRGQFLAHAKSDESLTDYEDVISAEIDRVGASRNEL